MKNVHSDFGLLSPPGLSGAARASDAEVSILPVGGEGQLADADELSPKLRASIRVLVIDDDRTLREGCVSLLQGEGYSVTVSGRGDEAVEVARRSAFDIVLVDLYMTPISGMEILKAVLSARPKTIVVVMTGNPSVTSSVDALRLGAWDYLPKPFTATHLQVLFGRAAHAVLAKRDEDTARADMLERNGNSDKIVLLGTSQAFRRAVDLARKVALTDASVMLVGESGTGKELIAQFIHQHGRRAKQRLVPLNCAAMPEQLLESEMFGHKKGSFTGADRDKVGLLGGCERGHVLSRRAHGDVVAAPSQAAPRDSRRRGAARGERAAGCGRGRAVHLRDQS